MFRRGRPRTPRRAPSILAGAEDIESFHQRFVTLKTLSEESELHRNTIRGLLLASRVSRFAPDGEDFGPVYLRNEATKAVRAAG